MPNDPNSLSASDPLSDTFPVRLAAALAADREQLSLSYLLFPFGFDTRALALAMIQVQGLLQWHTYRDVNGQLRAPTADEASEGAWQEAYTQALIVEATLAQWEDQAHIWGELPFLSRCRCLGSQTTWGELFPHEDWDLATLPRHLARVTFLLAQWSPRTCREARISTRQLAELRFHSAHLLTALRRWVAYAHRFHPFPPRHLILLPPPDPITRWLASQRPPAPPATDSPSPPNQLDLFSDIEGLVHAKDRRG
ncbi:MAG: hypothetical protein HYZ81_22635 [Nitrospinae bacterium]|nr:hypothetical protein [Nitrospinota bacterium]